MIVATKDNKIQTVTIEKNFDTKTEKVTYKVSNYDKFSWETETFTYKRIDFAAKKYLFFEGSFTPASEIVEMCRSTEEKAEEVDEVATEEHEEAKEQTTEEETEKPYTIRDEFPEPNADSVEGYRYIKAKTGAEIREEAKNLEQMDFDERYTVSEFEDGDIIRMIVIHPMTVDQIRAVCAEIEADEIYYAVGTDDPTTPIKMEVNRGLSERLASVLRVSRMN